MVSLSAREKVTFFPKYNLQKKHHQNNLQSHFVQHVFIIQIMNQEHEALDKRVYHPNQDLGKRYSSCEGSSKTLRKSKLFEG